MKFSAIVTTGLTVLLLLTASFMQALERERRPNVIIIIADDAGFSDTGAYGSEIETPNLDELAEGGLRFTQMEAASECIPSRSALLTGLHAQQADIYNQPGQLRNAVTFGKVLKSVGYRTFFVGKHHGTDNPYNMGFDHYRGLRDGAANYFNPGRKRPGDPGPPARKENFAPRTFVFDDSLVRPYTPPIGYYSTDTWTDWAIDLLEKYEDDEAPFCLYLSYQAPHDPLQAPKESIQKYAGVYEAGFDSIARNRYRRQRKMGLLDERYPRSEPVYYHWDTLNNSARYDQVRRMQVYAAMIDRMDANIGRLISKVKAMGEWENTLIIFTSDNGASAEAVQAGYGPVGSMIRWTSLKKGWANVANTPFRRYKTYSHEGGTSVPFIVHWPRGIEQGGRIDHTPAHFTDLLPTIIDITGASYPEYYKGEKVYPLEGISLLPILKGGDISREAPLFFHWNQSSAIRTDRWKLVRYESAWELYDMKTDRTETINLADQRPEVVRQLRARWLNWSRRVGIKNNE